MPKSKSNENQTEEFNIKMIDRSDELFKEIEKIYKEQDELIRAIESIEDPFENIVMRLLYIDGLSWNEVQIQLRCSRSTIKRARESALKSLSKNGTNRTK
jgi:DNA-directed RNA polymerase specialized sigma subunit